MYLSFLCLILGNVLWRPAGPTAGLCLEPPEQAQTYKPEHWKLWTTRKEHLASALLLFSHVGEHWGQLFKAAELYLKEKTAPNLQHLEMMTEGIEHYYSSSGHSCIHCWPYFNTFLKFLKISFIWKEDCDLVVLYLGSEGYSCVSGYMCLDFLDLEYSRSENWEPLRH